MFKNIDEFRQFNSALILRCTLLIYSILSIAYVIEFFKGNLSFLYVAVFCTIIWGSYFLDRLTSIMSKYRESTPVITVLGFLAIYSYCMYTKFSSQTWAYIFPFSVLILFYFKHVWLIALSYAYMVALNIVDLIVHFEEFTGTPLALTETKQRLSCVILGTLFLSVMCSLLRRYETVVTDLYKEAAIDALTGLKNKDFVDEKVTQMINMNKQVPYTMVMLNVDKFSHINEMYGHSYGDILLAKVGNIVLEETKNYGNKMLNASRIYGDKFIIIFVNKNYDEVKDCYRAIRSRLNALILSRGSKEIIVHATISITDTRFCEHTYEELYKRAKFLQDRARLKGENNLIEDSVEFME
jgi:diguanylate cyclase (GGDEF)-like protein